VRKVQKKTKKIFKLIGLLTTKPHGRKIGWVVGGGQDEKMYRKHLCKRTVGQGRTRKKKTGGDCRAQEKLEEKQKQAALSVPREWMERRTGKRQRGKAAGRQRETLSPGPIFA